MAKTSRPIPLAAATLAWLLGVSMAYGKGAALAPDPILAGAFAALVTILSLHYANEYADYETDALTRRTHYSGGSGALPAGLISRSFTLKATIVALLAGLTAQVLAVLSGIHHWSALALLLISSFWGLMYYPPAPLGPGRLFGSPRRPCIG